ncbi:polyADP-ribosyltransferase [Heterostelium album PN500]|uniref:Poly [ADP-ribose] polymerase n=1 Tax=Heterostelium pallidum (strain ATCC 26659 / Pp 5 / PN500) TaxID=670386 RepID=D3BCL7_HETP5|nr:polyADP-ribosyltransferase [Heterostelium album PN500]EFA80659.1 polyADP-ribosyltransferase [Heterostelium album PN500]|eukprot:XP_020432779.1 polyADP-ribosyltransferase [Heterostelium album PN500]
MPPKKRTISASDDAEASNSMFSGMVVMAIGSSFTTTQSVLLGKITDKGGSVAKVYNASKVTHIVTTQADYDKSVGHRAGLNFLKGVKNGNQIVSEDFFLKSIEKNAKQSEKDYAIKIAEAKEDKEEEEEEEEKEKEKEPEVAPVAQEPDVEDEEPAKPTTRKRSKAAAEPKKTKEEKEKEKLMAEVDSDLDSSDEEEVSTKTTIKIKGRCAVDINCAQVNVTHVYDDGTVWDATLNQTEIKNNNNKFYIIQLLEADNGGMYYVWNRWGREGLVGQSKIESYTNKNQAMASFSKKYKEKTKNDFNSGKPFVKYPGKYDLVEIDYTVKDDKPKAEKKKAVHQGESKLDNRVQNFIKLIFDLKMMKKTMIEADYDLKKMPLGKLSKNQILKGYEVLKAIEEKITKPSARGDTLVDLSSRFYTAIPHAFGMRVPPVINSLFMVKEKMDMLTALADIEIAANLIKESDNDDSNIIDAHYKQLKCDIQPIEVGSEEYNNIATYVSNTYAGKTPKIISLFRINREGETGRFETKKSLGNRKLLWHGSRLTNFVGIISQGLRIAPPEAPVSGYRFGKGIYFADIMSLSAAYCRTSGTDDFCMFLGDVALGKTADLYRDTYMEKPQPGSDSTLALGMKEPDPSMVHKHADGFDIPYGKIVPSPYKSTSCSEHQYVVYDVSQILGNIVKMLKTGLKTCLLEINGGLLMQQRNYAKRMVSKKIYTQLKREKVDWDTIKSSKILERLSEPPVINQFGDIKQQVNAMVEAMHDLTGPNTGKIISTQEQAVAYENASSDLLDMINKIKYETKEAHLEADIASGKQQVRAVSARSLVKKMLNSQQQKNNDLLISELVDGEQIDMSLAEKYADVNPENIDDIDVVNARLVAVRDSIKEYKDLHRNDDYTAEETFQLTQYRELKYALYKRREQLLAASEIDPREKSKRNSRFFYQPGENSPLFDFAKMKLEEINAMELKELERQKNVIEYAKLLREKKKEDIASDMSKV